MYNGDWKRGASPAAGKHRPGEERGEVAVSSATRGGARGGLSPPLPLLASHLVVVDHQAGVAWFAERFEIDDSKPFACDFRAPAGPGFDFDGHPAEALEEERSSFLHRGCIFEVTRPTLSTHQLP